MAWSTPRTWVTGEVVTSTEMNTDVRDNFNYLKGNAGNISLGCQLISFSDGKSTLRISGSSIYKIQMGAVYCSGDLDIAYPEVFAGTPVVVASNDSNSLQSVTSVTANGFHVALRTTNAGAAGGTVSWIAVGPG